MPYPKVKTESYRNLNGINSKVSPYQLSQEEFFDLSNVNFVTPGSLTKRPGTTLYIGFTVLEKINGIYEYSKISGASFFVATGATNIYSVFTGGFSLIGPTVAVGGGYYDTLGTSASIFDFVTFADNLFLSNGYNFLRFNGTAMSSYALPIPSATGVGRALSGPAQGSGATYFLQWGYGYKNDRGFLSPPSQNQAGSPIIPNIVFAPTVNSVITLSGVTAPAGFGISCYVVWLSAATASDGTIGQRYKAAELNLSSGTTLVVTIPDSSTLTESTFEQDLDYVDAGLLNTPFAPKYLEIYNNQLFMANFQGNESTVWWSEIGEPQAVDPTFSVEVRTNDGDVISGLKAYSGSLVITKTKSFHRITGDNPSNFLLTEISDQYGCLSNRAMVTYDDTLLFLDQKGIVKYNGSNVQIISNRVEPIFARMNVAAARENACAVHYKEYNEVWFSIPVDGSTKNNVTIVYDYLSNGWTKYDGLDISALTIAQGRFTKRKAFYGGYTGGIFDFDSAYYGDNGNGISCLIGSRFIAPMGQSVEELYRRLYLDVDPVTGVTQPITVEMKTNYGATIQLTRTMYQNPFQSRIDFGLSARSLAINFNHYSASLPFKVNGWTIESRFQRNV